MESQITEIAQGAEINRSQLASLFAAVEQVRGDLSASEEQTLPSAKLPASWRTRPR